MTDETWVWVEPLCRIALRWRAGDVAVRELFEDADPGLKDATVAVAKIKRCLLGVPALVDAWHGYSEGKRGTPSPYIDGCEGRIRDERRYSSGRPPVR